jgi:hypothetical protein
MNAILSQFRRIYADHGANDKDFSEQEARLRAANLKLANAAQALVRSSVYLNDVLIANGFALDKSDLH